MYDICMKTRAKTSPIWTTPYIDFCRIVKESKSIADICRVFGYSVTGQCHKAIKQRIALDGIDASHIPLGRYSNQRRRFKQPKVPLEKVLVEYSTYNRFHLKRRLLEEGLIENKCSICKQIPEWNNQPLTLVLDHENGIRNDNRRENLRLICPNCNSQQKTFSGRNKIRYSAVTEQGERTSIRHIRTRKASRASHRSGGLDGDQGLASRQHA
jgi:hypothetical protein